MLASTVREDTMSRINTNVPSIRTVNRLNYNYLDLNTRLERLSTGLRISYSNDSIGDEYAPSGGSLAWTFSASLGSGRF